MSAIDDFFVCVHVMIDGGPENDDLRCVMCDKLLWKVGQNNYTVYYHFYTHVWVYDEEVCFERFICKDCREEFAGRSLKFLDLSNDFRAEIISCLYDPPQEDICLEYEGEVYYDDE